MIKIYTHLVAVLLLGFSLTNTSSGQELKLVADINTGTYSSNPKFFFVLNNKLYFVADDGINGSGLFQYDDVNNTAVVFDVDDVFFNPNNLTVI